MIISKQRAATRRKRDRAGNGVSELHRRLTAKIRPARERMGLAQAELARQLGITKSSMCRIESGHRTASYDTVQRIAAILGISLDQLR